MFREQLNHMNLEKEFKKLAQGSSLSLKKPVKLFTVFAVKALSAFKDALLYFVNPPRIYENVAPGKSREVEVRAEHSLFQHPPNLK